MVAYYDERGVYRDAQGNPSPDPRTGVINTGGIGESLANLFDAPYTPGGAWDPSMGGSDDYIGPTITHDPTALATGRSTGGTFMPRSVQIGSGAPTPAKGIQADTLEEDINQEAGAVGNIWDNVMLGVEEPGPSTFHIRGTEEIPPSIDTGTLPGDNIVPKKVTAKQKTTINRPEDNKGKTVEETTKTVSEKEAAPAQEAPDTSRQAGFERLLNVLGGYGDQARDVIMGLANEANIGIDRFFNRPSAERDARLDRKKAGQIRARDESIGDIGTQLYDLDKTMQERLQNYPTDASAELGPANQFLAQLLGTGHDTAASTKGSLGDQARQQIEARRNAVGQIPDIPTAVEQPVGPDENVAPLPRPSPAGADVETGEITLPVDSGNAPLVDLVNQLAPLTQAQRAGMLQRFDPETRDIILQMLDDRDNIATGI